MHVHLDPVGGIAGGMFVAALLDAFPDQMDGVIKAVRLAGLEHDVVTTVLDVDDGVLVGKRFDVRRPAGKHASRRHEDDDQRCDHHHHDHTRRAELSGQLSASAMPDGVKRHALGIFGELAWAEAKVHGKEIDAITFHEVANWDSIADLVAAAALFDAIAVAGTAADKAGVIQPVQR